MIRSAEIVDPLGHLLSPVPNVLRVLPSEASAALAPTCGEDPAAALGVPSMEDHEMLAAPADIDRMVEIGAAAGAM